MGIKIWLRVSILKTSKELISVPGTKLIIGTQLWYRKERTKDQEVTSEASSFIYKLLDQNPTRGTIYHWKLDENGIGCTPEYEFWCGRKWQKQGLTLPKFL